LTNDVDVAKIRVWLDDYFFIYKIRLKHEAYFNAFTAINRTISCLQKRMKMRSIRMKMHTFRLSETFDYLLGSELDVEHESKSIYNTRFTETYDAHKAIHTSDNMNTFAKVGVERAFVSHFGSDMSKHFDKAVHDFDFLKVDLDYYAFLLTVFNQLQTN
jgi:hypothetical protein